MPDGIHLNLKISFRSVWVMLIRVKRGLPEICILYPVLHTSQLMGLQKAESYFALPPTLQLLSCVIAIFGT